MENSNRRLKVLHRILQPLVQLNGVSTTDKQQTQQLSVELEAAPPDLSLAYSTILTPDAIKFVGQLVTAFGTRVDEIHHQRLERRCRVNQPHYLPTFSKSPAHNDRSWKIAPLPSRLVNRHLDLGDVSPANTDHLARALSAEVQGVQVDFDDGHCPTWRNQILGLYNVWRAVRGQLPGAPPLSQAPVLMLRPRAWNMTEHNMMVNGREVPGPLFDLGILLIHNAQLLASTGSGPFLYLSKVEAASEARLWNDIFVWCEHKLQLAHGTIKACVLIENILSVFEMDDILFELRDHSIGLNCGIWDYAASIITKFGSRQQFLLPDRNRYVSVEQRFLRSYMRLVVSTCHLRGALATGGMAAAILPQQDAQRVVTNVRRAKSWEIRQGLDGFMVYDLALVPHMNQLWAQSSHLSQEPEEAVSEDHLLEMPCGGVTAAGLRHNISVGVLFIFHWLQGKGHFYYQSSVEDSATAEISRSQVWQWLRHQVVVEDIDTTVTKKLIKHLIEEFVSGWLANSTALQAHQSKQVIHQLHTAAAMFVNIVSIRDCPEFITTYLNDDHTFWSFHKN